MFQRPDDGPARLRRRLHGAIVAGAAFVLLAPGVAAAQAQGTHPPGSAERYQADRALCISGLSHQEREDCLREAAAARQAARRGQLEVDEADYRRNALRRCDPLPEQARQDCIARIRGEGTMIEGSVEEGGILRERRELVPRQEVVPQRELAPQRKVVPREVVPAPSPRQAPAGPPARPPAGRGAAG